MGDPNKHYITVNGKRYSAATGKVLFHDVAPAKKPSAHVVVSPSTVPDTTSAAPYIVPVTKPVGAAKKTSHSARQRIAVEADVIHSSAQRSQTLARKYVKKPLVADKPRAHAVTSITAIGAFSAKHEHFSHIAQDRLHHADTIDTHPEVHKFGNEVTRVLRSIEKTITDLPVKDIPDEIDTIMQAPLIQEVVTKSEAFAHEVETAASHLVEPIEQKLSVRHRVARKLGVQPRAITTGITLIVGIVAFGAVLYQNLPSLSVKVAAHRAGVSAAMPAYAPNSFTFHGPVEYSTGKVSISYVSKNNQGTYKISQQATKWNADNLATLYLTATGKTYQTTNAAGRTVYTYDGSNATWVNRGVWYTVTGDASLSTDQLLRIASSI